ncbi:MAG: Mu-like prophage major head subunit gpT family protein [Streptosporangiaceae bacterium]|nr:Mu-like prophage major head subunit gpT family protein [Streptosporangiaceae bacterium]
MLPAIDEVVMTKYSRYPDEFSEVFRMESSSRSIEQTTEVSGFGQFSVVAEGDTTRYDEALPAFNKSYVHAQYGLGFKVTRVAMDDDKFGVTRKLATELGRSAKETVEVAAANVFNTGFTSATGPDGVALFSTAHPLVGGGTQTNKLSYATDPDVTSIQLALTDIRNTVDHRGKKLRIPPKKMIVPPALEFVTAELLGGNDRPDTANRAINAFKRRSGMPSFDSWMVWDYLTDPNAWFIQCEKEDTELRFYWREQFNTVHDIDFDSRSVKTAGWMRFSVGFNGFYGVYGIPSS